MKFLVLSSVLFSASAFTTPWSPALSSVARNRDTSIFVSDVNDDTSVTSVEATADFARTELMELATSLKDQYGVLLIDSKAKESFRKAVEKLESVAELPSDTSSLVGDWTLVCSSASSEATERINIDISKIPFINEGPISDIKNTLKDSVDVIQRIKFGDMSNSIDAIDHVIDYSPPNQMSAFLKNVPDAIKNLDINPVRN